MTQDRLNSLAIMSIESQEARQVDLGTILQDFSEKKLRNMLYISIVYINLLYKFTFNKIQLFLFINIL